MKSIFSFTILLLLIGLKVFPQKHLADSLLVKLPAQTGLIKAKLLVDLSNAMVYYAASDALKYAGEAYQLADRINSDSVKYEALRAMGYANGYLGLFQISLQNMKDGLAYYESVHDTVNMAKALSDVAYLLQALSSTQDNVMEYNLKALSLREKIGDEKGIAYSLNNIGALYWDWAKYDRSIEYFLKALPYFERLNLKEEIATITGNIGAYYLKSNNFFNAEKYLQKAKHTYISLNHDYGLSMTLMNLARLNFLQDKLDTAILLNQKSIELGIQIDDKKGLANTHYNLGSIYLQQSKFELAEEALLASKAYAEQIGLKKRLIETYLVLAELYELQNDAGNALKYLKQSKALNDSIFSVEQHRQLEEIKTKYETEKKENKNLILLEENASQQVILRKNRFILYLSMVLGFMMTLFIVLFYQKRHTKYEIEALISEQRMLRSQMNPHFIFNSLTVIQSYILKQSPEKASSYLSSFAALMRQILESSSKDFIELDSELKMLRNYFSLQQLRYSGNFDYTINIDKRLNPEELLIPPMLNQPFIENAIEHGLKNVDYKGEIVLSYVLLKDIIEVEISDNGIGILNNHMENTEGHQSFAIEATQHRLKAISKRQKTAYKFEISDQSTLGSNQHGTIVKYTIPMVTSF